MSQFELISKSDIFIKDPQTGLPTGQKIKAGGLQVCITLPDTISAGTLFSSAKVDPIVLNAVNAKLGFTLDISQFNAATWKILSSK